MGCGSRRWEGDGIMGYGRGRGPGGRGRHQSIRVPTFPELPDPPGRPPPPHLPLRRRRRGLPLRTIQVLQKGRFFRALLTTRATLPASVRRVLIYSYIFSF